METDRRNFLRTVACTGAGLACGALSSLAGDTLRSRRRNIKLGLDNFSLRAWGWNAGQFLEYAAAQRLDVMLFSDLKVYESHEEGYLKQLRASGRDPKEYEKAFQRAELERSLKYCREVLGLGMKA